MTSEEIEALQMGDIIQFPDGKYAEVRSTNNVDRNINLRMLSGDTSIAVGELPPELVNVDTTCICPWADLSAAEFISNAAPLAQGKVSAPFITERLEKLEPYLPKKFRKTLALGSMSEELKAKLFFSHLDPPEVKAETFALTPETMAAPPQVAPREDGELTEAGTVLDTPFMVEPPEQLPNPIPPP